MRILLYTNHLGRQSVNGTAITIMVKELSDRLVQLGHEVLIVGNKNIVDEEISTRYISLKDISGKGGDLNYGYTLSKVVKDFSPDIAYAFMRPMSTILAISTLFYKSEKTLYVGSFHNANNYLTYGRPVYLPYRWVVGKLLEKLDILVAPSFSILQDIKNTYYISQEKLKIHPNFINFNKISKKAFEEEVSEENYILNIGRLDPQKNQKLLLRVFKRVAQKFPDLKLIIVGDGPLKQELIEYTSKLKIVEKVRFVGYQSNPWKYFRKAKLFVLSSVFEGSPLVIIESMYFKTPVVSFDIEPVLELTENGRYAITAKSFDENDLYDKIVFTLQQEEKLKTMLEEAYNKALKFSLDSFIMNMEKFYYELKR